ncbi:hypothetical protein O0L34_g15797 [Tuta absoluta]|nr:hypothetical protein O0L34_g15797 [Tuta absoluta]
MKSKTPKMWYLKACRSCLTTTGHLEKIGPQAKRLFCVITGLQLEEGDGLPQYFCAECYAHVKKALQFRRRSRRAHFVLKEIYAVKKQVTQPDVERVDRVKTNLISPYSLWKPEDTIFSYTTPDAVDPPVDITPDIEAALKESLNQPVFDIQCNSDAKTIKIDLIRSEPTYLNTQSVEQNRTGELIKLQLETLKSSSILVDIKPANWREIEREEEDRRKKERQMEIDAAIHDIHADDYFDDGAVDDTEVVPEDIDMEDIFKGLKEESAKESESEPEPEFEIEIPKKTETKNRSNTAPEEKTKDTSGMARTPSKKLPLFLKTTPRRLIVDILSKSKITYMPLDEQKQVFTKLMNSMVAWKAIYKCGICLIMFNTVEDLKQHVDYHNEKVKFRHICDICKDRFETEHDLETHGSLIHWYKYECTNCNAAHYTLKSLIKCHDTIKLKDWQIRNQFRLCPVPPHQMYHPPKHWSGNKHDTYKCEHCKIYFSKEVEWQCHIDGHKPVAPSQAHFECDICHLNLLNHKTMEEHMEHWHVYTYECKTCKKPFQNRMQAKQHLSKMHPKRLCYNCNKEFSNHYTFKTHECNSYRVGCNMCKETAPDANELLLHQLVTHGYIRLNTVPELNDVRFYCKLCSIYFTEERLLFCHSVVMKHPTADDYDNGCKHCLQWFESKEEVVKHKCLNYVTKCAGGYPRKCSYCDVICESSWKLKLHCARNHGERSEVTGLMRLCELCGKVFSVQSYHQHKRKQHGITKGVKRDGHMEIPCRFCPLKSLSATHHVSHILFNHTAKPYRCNLCGSRYLFRAQCRDHILKTHAPVLPYACEACKRSFAHLDYLHAHCLETHAVDLKKTDKSVYLSKRMFGKVYTYPDMKIDGSLIDLTILERTPVEVCDYLDDNNKTIDYKDVFFFDQDIDPSRPTRAPPLPNKKRTVEQEKRRYLKRKQRKLENKMERIKSEKDTDEIKIDSLPDIGENIKEEYTNEVVSDTKEENNETKEENDDTTEHEDVVGQLIEKDGQYFVLVDGELYSLEEECVENIKAMGDNVSLVIE